MLVKATIISNDVNREQVSSFQSGKTRKKWLRINDIANEFADAMSGGDWERAAALVQEENDIRLSMVPDRITQEGKWLQAAAQEIGGGFGITGAGNRGCVWAICPLQKRASALKLMWQELLKDVPNSKVLNFEIDNFGVVVEAVEAQ